MRRLRAHALALLVAGCSQPATPPRAVVVRDASVVERRVVVRSVTGRVERTRGTAPATPLAAGDVLSLDDVLETGPDAVATIDVGGTQVVIDPASKLSVLALARGVSRVRLSGGRISADVEGAEPSRFAVEVAGSDAVAETERGRFSVLRSGGAVVVAAQDGKVRFSARGSSVEVGAGQQSLSQGDKPPTPPAAIPPSLFLKLGRPRALAQREKETTITGSTSPGAIVMVAGKETTADSDGTFRATVPLTEGQNALTVEARDALGRSQRQALPTITVDTRPPKVDTKVTW